MKTLEWPLVQVVCRLKTVTKQDKSWIIEWAQTTFRTGRQSLSVSLVTWLGGDPSPEILQKLTSCLIQWTKRLYRNWLEDTLIIQTGLFGDFELSRTFRCCAGLPCRCCHKRISHSTYGRDVPGQRFASLPRNQCEAVRPFAIWPH